MESFLGFHDLALWWIDIPCDDLQQKVILMAEGAEISFIYNSEARKRHAFGSLTQPFSTSAALSVRRFHQSFPQYAPTPLVTLTNLAHLLQVSNIWIKDESYRFGLNAFKALGATYALACVIGEKLGINVEDLSFDLLKASNAKKRLGDITLILLISTEGNTDPEMYQKIVSVWGTG